ncbi:bacterial self-protective colicin-like immunity family protein [Pseudomonas aeruginosa]|nr:bacterial self-protective colicin-like immunity family protein [Pseudomonas aeruginosa]
MSMALIDLARNFLDGSLSGKSFTKNSLKCGVAKVRQAC